MAGMDATPRREEIRRLLERREREGLSYNELAEECGLSPKTLSWWSWRLRRDRRGRRNRSFVELVPSGHTDRRVGEEFDVLLRSGRRISLSRDFDEETLVRLVRVLEGAC